MNIRDEEQLQQYFERGMTPGEEQNFLINVAAREDMRLAFRSQLELLKAVREDKDASGSPTFVRSKTLTALGLGGALVPSSLREHEVQSATLSPSILQNVGNAFRRPMVSLTAGLLFGILGSSFFMARPVNEPTVISHPVIVTPAIQTIPQTAVPSSIVQESVNENVSHKTTVMHSTNKPKIGNHPTMDPSTPVTTETKPSSVKSTVKVNKPDNSEKK
jgi:hypothetical protein